MHDPWIEKLSEHVDGLLDEAGTRDLLEHLRECAECRAIVEDLRTIAATARAAMPLEPTRDLWPDIAARLSTVERTSDEPSAPAADSAPAATARPAPGASSRTRPMPRRFSFSMPQLAAAAVVLMTVSGATVWLLRGAADAPVAASGTIVQSAGGADRSTRTVAAVPAPAYTADVADLEQALERNSGQLDPATVEVIERSLFAIDNAIADARAALEADPGNPYLHRQLDNTMRKKIDILQRATRVQRAGS